MVRERLGVMADRPALIDAILPALDGHGEMVDHMMRALVQTPPTEAQNGGYIAEGYDAALDVLRTFERFFETGHDDDVFSLCAFYRFVRLLGALRKGGLRCT